MGLTMKEKQAVTREYRPRYHKASKKKKKTLPDEFTMLTGYHRKSAVQLLSVKPVKQTLLYIGGKPVKIKIPSPLPTSLQAGSNYVPSSITNNEQWGMRKNA